MLTEEGLKRLEEELEVLKGEKRKEIAEKIKVARSYGDLSENSEYDDAKNEQAILEARIADIEASLKNAVIIAKANIQNYNFSNFLLDENTSLSVLLTTLEFCILKCLSITLIA